MPFEAYIGYLTDKDKDERPEIAAGEPFTIEVRDLETFERKIVRALVAAPPAALEGGEALWVLDWIEARLEAPWSIRILEELDEAAAEAERSDIGEAERRAGTQESEQYGGKRYRGSQMPDMMVQDEALKYFENVADKTRKR